MSAASKKPASAAPPLAIRLRYWPTELQLLLMRLIARLPLRAVRWIGAALGTLLWPLARERRQITLRNLELCFPDKSAADRLHLARRNFRNTAIGFMETAKVWFSTSAQLAKQVEIEGFEHLQAAAANGKGVLVLAFHLTDLELGAVSLARYCQLAGMYRPHADPVFEHAMRSGRERHFPMIPRDDVRAMLRWLKQGGCVWYAADQDYGAQHSVFVPFFGIPAATITATSRFAKLSGAAVVPFTHQRTKNGIKLVLHAALDAIPSGDESADATTANQFLQAWLQQHPADYLWLHRRFKTRPPDAASLYPGRASRYRPGEISGKRYDKWLRSGKLLSASESSGVKRIALQAQLVDIFPARFLPLVTPRSDAERFQLQALQHWQQQGLLLAQPQRLFCPARQVVLHRYDQVQTLAAALISSNAAAVIAALAQTLRCLHDAGIAVAVDALQLAGSASEQKIILPLLSSVSPGEAISNPAREVLLQNATPQLIAAYWATQKDAVQLEHATSIANKENAHRD